MSLHKEFLAAGPGCALSNALLNSFELTKVKLQLHDNKSKNPVYSHPTTRGVMMQIAKEEGVLYGLLTPGLTASLTRSGLYGAYRVGLYSAVRSRISGSGNNNEGQQQPPQEPTLFHRLLSGMITGGIGSMISCPLDVVRTRMQADSGLVCTTSNRYMTGLRRGKVVRYHGMISAFVTIGREEGLRRGLYRGASVTVLRASLLNGAQLASYDTFKKRLDWEEGPILHSVCALISGVVAQTVIMPIDTIKSQMMLGNSWREVAEITRNRGFVYLYRGWVPACCGQSMIMVLQMPLIEEFRRLLGVEAI